jgi:uncharacterized protein (DUF1778 family)
MQIVANGTINGNSGKPKRKKINLRLRFRTQKDMEEIRKAARTKGQSMNAYIVTHILAQARTHLSYRD